MSGEMNKFFDGMSPNGPMTFKRIAVIGGSGGLFIGASDYWVDEWFADETDTVTQQRYRAASQIAVGLAAAYLIKRWNRDVAVGVAVGGLVGGARRLWISEEMPEKMQEWFGDDDTASDSSQQGTERNVNGIGAGAMPEGHVVFTSPARARVRQVR